MILEAAGFLPELHGVVSHALIGPPARRALTQWRLDFPLPPEGLDPAQDNTVLAVAEKILLRGSTTLLSPTVEIAVTSELTIGDDLGGNAWLDSIMRVSQYGVGAYHHQDFDSKEEAIFYNELLPILAPNRNIFAWTTPQISAASLSNGALDPESKQRVDFLIAHPNGTQFVVEVDGLQHNSSREADFRRDTRLEDAGIRVFRIPVAEIRARAGPQISVLAQALQAIPLQTSLQLPPHDFALLLGRAASQIQIALLMAMKAGLLEISGAHPSKILVPSPSWYRDKKKWAHLANESIRDFAALLSAIHRLHHAEPLSPPVALATDPTSKADLAVVLDEPPIPPNAIAVLHVSNIYLPRRIQLTLPASNEVRILNPDREAAEWLLQYVFRKDRFWEGQWEAVSRALQRQDAIVLLPTGGGKSIAFQLASLLLPGACLVVDPLISLIEDQLDNLRAAGIDRAIGITSLLLPEDKHAALDSFSRGHYIFCYIAPERLQMEDFRRALRAVTTSSPVSLIAIDEAHCVSEWGHDFRTSYLNVARNARHYSNRDGTVPPLLGLTGTASRSVLKDIQRELQIEGFDAIITPRTFDRPELTLRVLQCRSSEKQARLKGYLAELPEQFRLSRNTFFQPRGPSTMAGLVFYPHINGEIGVSAGYQLLKEEAGSVGLYSGRPPSGVLPDHWDHLKAAYAKQFKHNELSVLVCTNAFGMGIDKPNIRYTIHMNLPRSIEAFYQEAGRAGRDRKRSECCLIISNDHPERTRRLLNPSTPLSEIESIVRGVPWEDADDITRMLYFHVTAFHGIEAEEATVSSLVSELGDIKNRRAAAIEYSKDNLPAREKAVHRLVILGVVEDYTQDYAHAEIRLRLSGLGKEAIAQRYLEYLRAYDHRLASQAEAAVTSALSFDHTPFVMILVRHLLEFIYGTVELGRRRSLAEMLQACTSGTMRQDILNYLALGAYSELLNSAMERQSNLGVVIQQLLDQVASPSDASELRGQTARLLESYPNNPALLMIRAFAEFLCRERDERVGLDNLGASVVFALSDTGWTLATDEVASAVVIMAEAINPADEELAASIVERFLSEAQDLRSAARAIVQKARAPFTWPAPQILLALLADRLDEVVDRG